MPPAALLASSLSSTVPIFSTPHYDQWLRHRRYSHMVCYRLGSYFRLGSGAGTITTLVLALLLVLLQVPTTVVTVGHTTVKPLPTTPSPTSTTRYLLNGNVVSDRVTDPKVQPATAPINNMVHHYLNQISFGIVWLTLGTSIGYMHRQHGDSGLMTGPHWDPAGTVPWREFEREVHAWLNVTAGRLTPPQQAAALQRGLAGHARQIAMRIPPGVINYGVNINGVATDGATYIMFILAARFSNLEDERQLTSGTALLDFQARRGDSIDV